ncbi:MAG: AI-2E family transporter [Candidatus Dojkabacteria bacterium]|nr:AI-2E family transporter [Candidatus Dojkabacteria bacterium]
MNKNQQLKVEISLKSIVIAILASLFMLTFSSYLFYPLILLFFAFLIYCGTKPVVNYIESLKIPRFISILVVYLFILVVLGFLFFIIIRQTSDQVSLFVQDIDTKILQFVNFVNENLPFLNDFFDLEQIKQADIRELINQIQNTDLFKNVISVFSSQGIRIALNTIEIVFSLFIIVFLSIYMLKPKQPFYIQLFKFMPHRAYSFSIKFMSKVESSLGAWTLGLLFLMLVIGIITYLVIFLPGLLYPDSFPLYKYALLVAIIAGLLEAVPNIGPTITLLITLFLGISTGVTLLGLVYIFVSFVLIQQLEGVFLVPFVMKKAVNLHPIISILGIVVGFSIAGPLGAFLSVPVIAVLQILFVEYFNAINQDSKSNNESNN